MKRSLDSIHQAHLVIEEMDKLLETGFKGRELKLVNHMIQELDSIEDDTDQMQIKLRKMLYTIESVITLLM